MSLIWKKMAISVFMAGFLLFMTNVYAASVDINLESLSVVLASVIDESLMTDAKAAADAVEAAAKTAKKQIDADVVKEAAAKAVDKVIEKTRPEFAKYLSPTDTDAVVKRFQGLLANLMKNVPRADILKPAIVQTLLKTAVQDALKRDKLAERVDELTKSVDRSNAGIKEKVLRVDKEVEFLYDMEVGDTYTFTDGCCLKHYYCQEGEIEIMLKHWYTPAYYIQCIKYSDVKPEVVKEIKLTDSEETRIKMAAVERTLGLPSDPDMKMIDRVTAAQKEIRNYNWERNHLFFGVMEGYLTRISTVSTSLVLHAYPAYRQYVPGRPDPLRRMSFFIGVGTASKKTDDAELTGPIYSTGIGIALREGVGLTFGYSAYKMKILSTDDEQMRGSFTFGVTLNSELWNSLFGGK